MDMYRYLSRFLSQDSWYQDPNWLEFLIRRLEPTFEFKKEKKKNKKDKQNEKKRIPNKKKAE